MELAVCTIIATTKVMCRMDGGTHFSTIFDQTKLRNMLNYALSSNMHTTQAHDQMEGLKIKEDSFRQSFGLPIYIQSGLP